MKKAEGYLECWQKVEPVIEALMKLVEHELRDGEYGDCLFCFKDIHTKDCPWIVTKQALSRLEKEL